MASISKRGSSWTVRITYYDQDGKRYQKSATFKTKLEAQHFAAQNELKKKHGYTPSASPTSFVQYFTDWYTVYKAPKVADATKRNYVFTLDQLKRWFKKTRIDKISRAMYQDFINYLAKNYARETVAKIAGHCRACVIDAIEDEILTRNFTIRTSVPRCTDAESEATTNYLNVADTIKLKDYLEPKASIHNISALMVLASLFSGARYSEIAGLTWNDINYQNCTLRFNKAWQSKGARKFSPTKTKAANRVVAVPKSLIRLLTTLHQDQLAANLINEYQLVFLGLQSSSIPTGTAVNRLLSKSHEQLGIRKITFHGLRHTHASYLIYKQISIYVIAKRLGHSDVGITQRVYTHIISELHQEQTSLIINVLEEL